jgi:hypothetical protein
MPKNRDSILILGGSADPAQTGSLQHNPLISIENFALSRSGELTGDRATYCKVLAPLTTPIPEFDARARRGARPRSMEKNDV